MADQANPKSGVQGSTEISADDRRTVTKVVNFVKDVGVKALPPAALRQMAMELNEVIQPILTAPPSEVVKPEDQAVATPKK